MSSLRTTVELAAHMDPGGVNPNYGSTNSDSPDDEDSGLDSGLDRNLEPNLWYMLPGMILGTARSQL